MGSSDRLADGWLAQSSLEAARAYDCDWTYASVLHDEF
jgi:hypothetical protein